MNTQEKFNLWVKMKIAEAQHDRAYHEYMNAVNGTNRTDLIDETVVAESGYQLMLNKNIYELHDLYDTYQKKADHYYDENDLVHGKKAAERAMALMFAIREYNAIEETEKLYEEAN